MVRKFFEYSVTLNADRIEVLKTNKINFSNCNSSAGDWRFCSFTQSYTLEAAFYKDERQSRRVDYFNLRSHGLINTDPRHFTKTTSFGMAVKTDYTMYLFTYFSNINRLFASIVKKNRLPLNNRFGGQLKFFGGNQGKYISFVWFDNWLFASHFSTASDVTYGAKTAHMCARSLSKVLREPPVVRRESKLRWRAKTWTRN